MTGFNSFFKKALILSIVFPGIFYSLAQAQNNSVNFDSERWIFMDAQSVEHLGRNGLMGTAYLKDVEFQNGIIEVDISVQNARSYPGLIFRMQSEENYENFYLRPHRSKFYPDALQYTPVFNGISGWQLYNGKGFTASAIIPSDKWLHLKIEIQGKQARVFLEDMDQPALLITDLKHGVSKGKIGVSGPKNNTAIFSNFSYRIDDSLQFPPLPYADIPPGLITHWQISDPLKASDLDPEHYPDQNELKAIRWQNILAEPSGLVDVARSITGVNREPAGIYARTEIPTTKNLTKKLWFGYSDEISIFCNGKLLFNGNSSYQLRDPSFLGIVGLNDAVYVPLRKGQNELLIILKESFGGWGFIFQDGEASYHDSNVKKLWQTEKILKIPETVIYDPTRTVFYISNFDGYNISDAGGQSIARLSLDGKSLDPEWITGLNNPVGMAISENLLYVLERRSLVQIDLPGRAIVQRYPIANARFLNDLAIDEIGNIYITDSFANIIYRFSHGQFEQWLIGPEVNRPNGIHYDNHRLIVGNNGDNCIKAIRISDKTVTTLAQLGPGIIDGIETDAEGNFLISQTEGRLYRISADGQITKLLDTSVQQILCANFVYCQDRNLLVIPTFTNNSVIAYELK